ncbi:MAG: M56 family metallopeptidase, partial [Faecousia sp.]
MSNLFSTVLNMSMTGSIVILLVMLARLLLKRSPKIFSYALWSAALFRLLCPVAFTAPVSVLEAFQPEVKEASDSTSIVYYLPAQLDQGREFTFVPAENQSGNPLEQAEPASHPELDIMKAASCIWMVGVVAMLLYSAVQYVRLRMKLIGAMVYSGNVYLADYLDTPFAMGILSPKIYLPSNVPTKERKYIIAHERHHIRRFDHVIKLLAYFALCIHWFNPLVWTAFILAGKDMEMSCDEAVIKR